MPVELRINGLGGPVCAVTGEMFWTLHQLKAAIEAVTGIPIYEQRLIYGTKDLGFATGGKLGSLLPRKETELDLTLVRLESAQASWLQKLEGQPWQLCFAPESVKADREVVFAAVQQNGAALEYAADVLRSDREIVLAAVRQNGYAFEYVGSELQGDPGVVLAAMRQTRFSQQLLQHIPPRLWHDRTFVSLVAKENEIGLKLASPNLQGDLELVSDIVQRCGSALQFVQKELRANRELVLAAVRRNGLALRYAADSLRADRQVVLAALKQDGAALQFAAEELQADKSIVLAAVRQRPIARHYSSPMLQMDPDILKFSLLGRHSHTTSF